MNRELCDVTNVKQKFEKSIIKTEELIIDKIDEHFKYNKNNKEIYIRNIKEIIKQIYLETIDNINEEGKIVIENSKELLNSFSSEKLDNPEYLKQKELELKQIKQRIYYLLIIHFNDQLVQICSN